MTILIPILILFMVGVYALFSLSNVGWRRFAGPGMLACVGVILIAGLFLTLGSPRPMWLANSLDGGSVVAIVYDEPNAIYIWVTPPLGTVPVAITIPWEDEKAEEIREAEEEAVDTGGLIYSENNEQPVHPVPVTSYPEKPDE